jgi:putative lipoic acid-binding regulatory protein
MNATTPSKDSLIDYPCDFPIKVMGLKVEGYIDAMSYVVRQFDPDWTEDRLETRESAGGKYLSLTFTVRATSREQLDELYRTLSSHPMAKVVL